MVLCIGGRAGPCATMRACCRSCASSTRREIGFAIYRRAARGGSGLAKGRKMTCYEHVRLELETCGGTYIKQDSVRDGHIVSSPTWREHPAFYRDVFACLGAKVAV